MDSAIAIDDLVSLTVLALLVQQPCHPYEMVRLIRQRRKDFVTGMPRSLYRAVSRLNQVGLIEVAETKREGNRPERTVFQITEAGRDEFYTHLGRIISAIPDGPSAFAAAVSFLPLLSEVDAANLLRSRASMLEDLLATAESALRSDGLRVHSIETERAAVLLWAEHDWLLMLIEDLESGRLAWQT